MKRSHPMRRIDVLKGIGVTIALLAGGVLSAERALAQSRPITIGYGEDKIVIATASHERIVLITTNILLAGNGTILLMLYRIGLHSRGVTDIVWFIKIALVQSILYLIVVWLIVRAVPLASAATSLPPSSDM